MAERTRAGRLLLAPLFMKSLRDKRKGILAWCLGTIGIIAVQMSVYPTIRDSSADWSSLVETFPEAFQKIFRMSDYTSPAGYFSTELYSLVLPLIFITLGATWGARLTCEDEEAGTADILYTLPVTRDAIMATRFLAATAVLGIVAVVTTAAMWTGCLILDLDLSVASLVAATGMLLMLGFFFLAMAGMLGAWRGHRSVSLGISLSFAIGAFVLYSLAPLVSAIDTINPWNPLQWTIGQQTLFDGLSLGYSVATVACAAVMTVAGFRFFRRRDIAG